jgi:tripartite-type tricarboxylate transporter receptor subunit TctC
MIYGVVAVTGRMTVVRIFVMAAALFSIMTAAQLQERFPNRPVHFVVPFTPGSATDVLARAIGQKLSEQWGQQVVVDNRAGAGSVVGTNIVAKALPDGYTWLMVSASHAVNVTLYSKLPYDTVKDFSGVTRVASIPNVLIVGTQVPAKNLKELIALARAQPGKLNYASAGIGSASHLNGELFNSMAGVKIVHIPFKGFPEEMNEILSGRIEMTWAPQLLAMSFIKAGRVNALAVSTAKRSTSLPDVPTAAEAGLPGFVFDPWFAVLVPAGVPKARINEINAAIVKTLQLPDVKERLLAAGAEPSWDTPQELDRYIASEIVKLGKVVRESGAKAD